MPRKKQSTQTDAKQAKFAPTAKAPHGSKSDFVRNLPQDMPAKEVVAKAKADGMKLSIAQVYNIRSTSKRRGKVAKVAKPAGTTAAVARTAAARGTSDTSDSEGRLRKLIAEVGLARARQVLAEVGAAFAG